MNILVINCGSSSVKADVVEVETGRRALTLRVERANAADPCYRFNDEAQTKPLQAGAFAFVLEQALGLLADRCSALPIAAVGHRVAHGGDRYAEPVRITPESEAVIESLTPLAPLHTPPILAGIRLAQKLFGALPHVAVFDTAFHATLPNRARFYALPQETAAKHGIQRYGFHGTSHQYVAQRAAEFLQTPLDELRLVSCHLGNGASVCAIEYGRSAETSMGMTPLEGLIMGTRSGDLDPGALLYLMEQEGWDVKEAGRQLNNLSGLFGLTGGLSDFRDIENQAEAGNEACRKAIQNFTHRVRKYIGAYAAVMGGADAIILTAGIGENSALARHRITQRLEFLGCRLDEDLNRDLKLTAEKPVVEISAPHSRCKILVVATDESRAIALQTAALVSENCLTNTEQKIPVAVSARHIHLTQANVEALFGAGHQLTPLKPLYQPGQFSCAETLTIVGPKNKIEKVRVLGPVRPKDQVEISRTDEFILGVDAPVRESGRTENTPPITLVGPAGTVHLPEGVICAWRHIHCSPDDAERFGVKDRDVVSVEIENGAKALTFGNVLVRVHKDFLLEMHIDTDEANAAEIGAEGLCYGKLIKRKLK